MVNSADLQKDLAAKLAESGQPAKSVTCSKDLRGAVDRTARCEVVFGPTDQVTAVVTTTQVEGSTVSYEITRPEMTREQLATRVAGLESGQSATCDTGLDGNVGDWSQCSVVKNGTTRTDFVEVRGVDGLVMDLSVAPALLQPQVEDLLLAKMAYSTGRRPDSAACPGDLIGIKGTTMECVVTIDDNPDKYVVTVTDVADGNVAFDYKSWAEETGRDPNVDYCKGCPG